MSAKKTLRTYRRAAEEQGWRVEETKSGHLRFIPADRSKPIVVASSTPSDARSVKNLRAQLRRSGLDV